MVLLSEEGAMPDSRFRKLLARLRYLLRRRKEVKPRDPEPQDPFAYVTAPLRPRPYPRSGAAVAELPEE